MSQYLLFYLFAGLITMCSFMVVLSRNPVTSAVFLIGDLFLLAGLYAMLEAHFVAAIQVLVYAGAVVVLFMFVIMLLNLGPETRASYKMNAAEVLVLLLTVVGFVTIAGLTASGTSLTLSGEQTVDAIAKAGGNTYAVGMYLFTKYLWPFELASILILLAIVACVVIAKKDSDKKSSPQGRGSHATN